MVRISIGKRRKKSSSSSQKSSSSSNQSAFQGPVRPGTDEQKFRDTGKSEGLVQGPVRPGTDEKTFRKGGGSSGGGSSGGGSSGGSSAPKEIGGVTVGTGSGKAELSDLKDVVEGTSSKVKTINPRTASSAEIQFASNQIRQQEKARRFAETEAKFEQVREEFPELRLTDLKGSFVDLVQTADSAEPDTAGEAFVKGFVPTNKQDALTFGLAFGAGGLLGAGLKGGGALVASKAPKFLPAFKGTTTVGGLGLGSAFAADTIVDFNQAETSIDKGEVLGETSRDLFAFGAGLKAGSGTTSNIIGKFRTRGKTELPANEIIASEFTSGKDKFPSIKKGETAGDLLTQFKQPKLPGETPGTARGFTARDKPLTDLTPASKPRKGELVGTFIAPDTSPAFFRQPGRTKAFGLGGEFTSGLPTLGRLTPASLEFAPGVKPSSKVGPLKFDTIKFSENVKGSGRAFIPFSKTEKEAVIAFDSPLINVKSDFFLRFQGDRIPIIQADVGAGKAKPGQLKVADILGSGSSSRATPSSSVVNPFSTAVPPISSSTSPPSSSSLSPPSSSFTPPSSPFAPPSRPKGSKPSRPRGSGSSPLGSSSGFSSLSSRSFLPEPFIPLPKSRDRFRFDFNPLGAPQRSRVKPGKRKFTRRPTLLAAELDITSPETFRGEITGLGTRPILKKKKKKRK